MASHKKKTNLAPAQNGLHCISPAPSLRRSFLLSGSLSLSISPYLPLSPQPSAPQTAPSSPKQRFGTRILTKLSTHTSAANKHHLLHHHHPPHHHHHHRQLYRMGPGWQQRQHLWPPMYPRQARTSHERKGTDGHEDDNAAASSSSSSFAAWTTTATMTMTTTTTTITTRGRVLSR